MNRFVSIPTDIGLSGRHLLGVILVLAFTERFLAHFCPELGDIGFRQGVLFTTLGIAGASVAAYFLNPLTFAALNWELKKPGILAGIALGLANAIYLPFLPGVGEQGIDDLMVSGVLSPFFEELFLRGLVLSVLKRYGIPLPVLMVTLISSYLHGYRGDYWLVSLFGDLTIAIAYIISKGNMWACITCHMTRNWLAYFFP